MFERGSKHILGKQMINCSPIRHHSSSKHLISSARDITPGVFRVSVRGEEQHVAEANKDYFEEIGQIQSRKIGQRQQDYIKGLQREVFCRVYSMMNYFNRYVMEQNEVLNRLKAKLENNEKYLIMKSQTIYNLEMKISQMQTVATQQPNRQHRLKALSSLGGNNREMGYQYSYIILGGAIYTRLRDIETKLRLLQQYYNYSCTTLYTKLDKLYLLIKDNYGPVQYKLISDIVIKYARLYQLELTVCGFYAKANCKLQDINTGISYLRKCIYRIRRQEGDKINIMRSKITLAQHGALFELEDLTMNKEVNKSGEGQYYFFHPQKDMYSSKTTISSADTKWMSSKVSIAGISPRATLREKRTSPCAEYMVSSKRYKKLASPISLRLSTADYGKEDARERQFVIEAEGKETISETSSRQPLRVRIDGSGFLKSVDTGLFVLDGNGNRVSASNIASLLLEHDVTVLA